MEFRILGPLEAWQAGRLISLGGPKQRALLAVLLMHANRVVPAGRLIELIWGEDAPETAVATLQVTISNLRKILEPEHPRGAVYEVLVSQPAGYVLQVSAEQLDSSRFESLAAAGRDALKTANPEAAADKFREALALWKGTALCDFSEERFAIAERQRLEEMRLGALEGRIEADLALGRHTDLIGELEVLVDEHPYRERLSSQLMLALYRSGRQAEASSLYYRTRQSLVEELGMEPSAEFQRLFKQILNQQLAEPAYRPKTNNLPIAFTSFVGRDREVTDVKHTLLTSRLLTLTGAGGIGKTRLALQAASELLEDFRDGIWLVELAPIATPELIPQATASALGLREQAGRGLVDTISAYLLNRNVLLLLDNCEHLVDAAARLVEVLLRTCPEVRVLATSREALDIGGETVRRVPSLSLPDNDDLASVDSLTSYEAVALFCDRAAIATDSFRLTQTTAPLVLQICRRLDGIPLAIELAVVRLKVLSLEQVGARLNDRFRLLTGGSRTVLPRQQTLRAAIDWSYDLLPDSERALLRRLAVFVGGTTLEAAEAVCAGAPIIPSEVLDLMTQLVAKSLVIAEEGADETQFRLLETIRQYGLDKLMEAGEAEQVRKRHCDWFVGLAERSESQLRGEHHTRWFRRLETSLDNLRAALDWCSGRGDGEACLRLASALGVFWQTLGYLSEGREWLDRGLTEANVPLSIRAKALVWASLLAVYQGDFGRAVLLGEEGLDAYRRLEDQWGTAFALQTLGRAAVLQDFNQQATSRIEQSLSLFREAGDKKAMATSLYLLGLVAWGTGDYSRATMLGNDALRLSREVGDMRNVATALEVLGRAEMSQGHLESAERLIHESLTEMQRLGDRRGIAVELHYLATLARYREDYTVAQGLAEECLTVSQNIGDKLLNGIALCELGILASLRGNPAAATRVLKESLETLLQTNERLYLGRCVEALASAADQQEQSDQAAVLFAAAEALREEIGAPLEPFEIAGHQRQVNSLRAQLGEAAWARAWSNGRKISLEQVVALISPDPKVSVAEY